LKEAVMAWDTISWFSRGPKTTTNIYNSSCHNPDLNKASPKCNTTTPNYLIL